jgi:hypothetical protein
MGRLAVERFGRPVGELNHAVLEELRLEACDVAIAEL